MNITCFKDTQTGEVYAYDDEQMSFINKINEPDFNHDDASVPDIFFMINEKIKGMYKMTVQEVEAHINPPVSKEQRIEEAELQKRQLLNESAEKIAIWQDAVDLDMATKKEKIALFVWRRYRVLLYRVDCSTAPDIAWPELPK
ncbi:tail fiber assembly protein [Xenorhabdus sp. M]|uniref:Tail fiber assembly protein n=1 Tax=Xenorhabdus szentirmaii TaxID=290112 RepID=A0AAW3YT99_9GAMM|nr:tail fiber assembly protein [Xenorhabdus sp. M]MBD2800314.1 tail fiber assembly protein [Xenorhabdus sp. M]